MWKRDLGISYAVCQLIPIIVQGLGDSSLVSSLREINKVRSIIARFRNSYVRPPTCVRKRRAANYIIARPVKCMCDKDSFLFRSLSTPRRNRRDKNGTILQDLVAVRKACRQLVCVRPDWSIYRRVHFCRSFLKNEHSECSIYRDRSLHRLLIFRICDEKFRFHFFFLPKGEVTARSELINFDLLSSVRTPTTHSEQCIAVKFYLISLY